MIEKAEEIVRRTDEKCNSLPSGLLTFKPGAQGREIRDKILDLVGYLSFFSEPYSMSKYRASVIKRKLANIKAKAMISICRDESLSRLASPIKEQYAEIFRININGEETCYNEVAEVYDAYVHSADRFASMFEDIKIAIMACQSVLSFDREEMKNIIS